MKKRIGLLFFACLGALAGAWAQGGLNTSLLTGGSILNQEFVETLPFERRGSLIIVEARLGNEKKPYKFLLANDAPTQVSGRLARETQTFVKADTRLEMATQRSEDLVGVLPQLQLGNVVFRDIGARIMPLNPSAYERCLLADVDGILGGNVLRLAAWQIDYAKSTLTFSNYPQRLPALPGKVDTISFSTNTITGEIWLDEALKIGGFKSNKVQVSLAGRERIGAGMAAFTKLSGGKTPEPAVRSEAFVEQNEDSTFQKGKRAYLRPAEVKIGTWTLSQPIVECQRSYESTVVLGSRLLARHVVRLDYLNQDLLVASPEAWYEPFENYGFFYLYETSRNRLLISEVLEGSYAWDTGVRPGDVVLEIGKIKVNPLDPARYCTLRNLPDEPDGEIYLKIRTPTGIRELYITPRSFLGSPRKP